MRIFQKLPLKINTIIQLDEKASHHLSRVLRVKTGDVITLFNGKGGEYEAIITEITKKNVSVEIKKFNPREAESPLELYLAQGISRGEKMDFTIQKAVELGVKKIIPLFTERCNVKLDEERSAKRLERWQDVIISACEQCGRNQLPEILAPQNLQNWQIEADVKLVLVPTAKTKLSELVIPKNSSVLLLIGPEGGLSDNEIQSLQQKEFVPIKLGARVLRTETAGVAALTACQLIAGDL